MDDGLGSTSALADNGGSVLGRYEYDVYGTTSVTPDSSSNRYLYTGREMDDADLYYYRARYYQPSQGRFLSEDGIGFASGQNNFYAYVGGSPINYRDPSGRCPWCIGAIVGGVIRGIAGGIGTDSQGNMTWDWGGAAAGALAGAVGGAVGGPLAGWVGGGLADAFGATAGWLGGGATASAWGGLSGAAGTMAGNYAGNKPLMKRAGFGAALGALAPFMTGEAAVAGLAKGVVAETTGDVFGGLSGLVGGVGGHLDPFKPCDPPAPATPEPDGHFPWPQFGW